MKVNKITLPGGWENRKKKKKFYFQEKETNKQSNSS